MITLRYSELTGMFYLTEKPAKTSGDTSVFEVAVFNVGMEIRAYGNKSGIMKCPENWIIG